MRISNFSHSFLSNSGPEIHIGIEKRIASLASPHHESELSVQPHACRKSRVALRPLDNFMSFRTGMKRKEFKNVLNYFL
jgi:hypothetical protein